MEFKEELRSLLNKYSIENVADMPDFILAGMICDFIDAVGPHIKQTLDWHGCDSTCHPIDPSTWLIKWKPIAAEISKMKEE